MTLTITFVNVTTVAAPIKDASQKEFADHGINVKWYGAKGNGTADDTQAIQRAFDTHGSVYFLKGFTL